MFFLCRIKICHVCQWYVPGVCAASPKFKFAGPCMARLGITSRHDTYACGVGVMRLLRSVLRRDATRLPIIFTNLWQRRCPVYWTLLLVIIPLNHHPGLCSSTRPRTWPFGVRGSGHVTYMCTRRAFTWIARCPSWSSPKGKTEDPSNISPTLFHANV